MNRSRSAFSSAWAALILGFAALGLAGLAFIGERAGVPLSMLQFLLNICVIGTLLGFGVSSLIVEPQRWSFAERRVRGISAVPAAIVLALTTAWATSGNLTTSAPIAIFIGCLAGLFLSILVLGPRMRRIGASSPGRMLSLRYTSWEGLPLRLLMGSVSCALLAGLVLHLLELVAERLVAGLSLSRIPAIALAAFVIFLPAWAGGITTLIRLSRIGFAFGIATVVVALLIGQTLPGSSLASLPLLPVDWDAAVLNTIGAGLLSIVFLPATMPVIGSLSTPRSNYRLAGWLAFLSAITITVLLWLGGPNDASVSAEQTLTSSGLAPLLTDMASLAMLAIGGSILLFALATSLIDDIVLSVMDEPSIVPGRLLAWRRFAMIGVVIGLTAGLLVIGDDALGIDRMAAPVFVAMAIAAYPPALLWSGASAIGVLAGISFAGLSQIVLLLVLQADALPAIAIHLDDGLICGLFGLAVAIVLSLVVPPRYDARQSASAMARTDDNAAFDRRAKSHPASPISVAS
ncbi:hypothetical protein [Notoacmeibacter sp. MSK16QG-6]|uniref:hypothetical protein n=1 Tax=Notoacmeibacter sp. MSK16QG-6 TaxID=2957982 RepID=UPI00209CE0CB|nr:hypothetical protein [Notoacmeibacter sp. MSK16QG-6]MCP1198596.1 hypothetical protein [Notoacmeibacter sp. MSK16QG-6]